MVPRGPRTSGKPRHRGRVGDGERDVELLGTGTRTRAIRSPMKPGSGYAWRMLPRLAPSSRRRVSSSSPRRGTRGSVTSQPSVIRTATPLSSTGATHRGRSSSPPRTDRRTALRKNCELRGRVAIRTPWRLPRLPGPSRTYGTSAGGASGRSGQVLDDNTGGWSASSSRTPSTRSVPSPLIEAARRRRVPVLVERSDVHRLSAVTAAFEVVPTMAFTLPAMAKGPSPETAHMRRPHRAILGRLEPASPLTGRAIILPYRGRRGSHPPIEYAPERV